MNALSTPSHLPSRQNSSRIPSGAEMTAEEELRSTRPETFSQQVSPLCHGCLSNSVPCLCPGASHNLAGLCHDTGSGSL